MSGTTPYARPLKPAGGIEAVWLIPASDIVSATYGDGCCTGLTLRAGASADQWPILEQSSSFREENLNPDGPPRFRHTLTLVVGREAFRKAFTPALRRAAETEGLIALVTMASGERLLAGWSARFGTSQPLRPDSFAMESGIKPLDGTPAVLTLASEDTDPAAELKEQEA